MWTYEHSLDSSAAPDAFWRLFADVPGWPAWNADIERIELDGCFEAGSTVLMTPAGQEPIRMRLAEVRPDELFVDETDLGDVQVRVEHRLERLPGGTRVTYRMQIGGPSAEAVGPRLGPAISGDFPDVMAALVARAEAQGA
jgi:uncharacterized protein YndB with AHSA1/START domain